MHLRGSRWLRCFDHLVYPRAANTLAPFHPPTTAPPAPRRPAHPAVRQAPAVTVACVQSGQQVAVLWARRGHGCLLRHAGCFSAGDQTAELTAKATPAAPPAGASECHKVVDKLWCTSCQEQEAAGAGHLHVMYCWTGICLRCQQSCSLKESLQAQPGLACQGVQHQAHATYLFF